MEELKLLVQMVASLPALAVWVIVAFYIYKITIIGSIYGVIRFIVSKIHDYGITQKTRLEQVNLHDKFYGITINQDETLDELIVQISRLKGKATGIKSSYIHKNSVDWLREAINEKERQDNSKLESNG